MSTLAYKNVDRPGTVAENGFTGLDATLPPAAKLPNKLEDRPSPISAKDERAADAEKAKEEAALNVISTKGLAVYIQSEIRDGKLSDGAKRVIARYLSEDHAVDAVKKTKDGVEVNPDTSVRSFRDVLQDAFEKAESSGSHKVQVDYQEPNSKAERMVFTDAKGNRMVFVLHADIQMVPDAKDPTKSRFTNQMEFSQFSIKYQTAEQFRRGEAPAVVLDVDRGAR